MRTICPYGARVLEPAWRHCGASGGRLAAVNPTEAVARLLEMTGIARFLLPVA
jgi:anti-anti-sigma regulatory factor